MTNSRTLPNEQAPADEGRRATRGPARLAGPTGSNQFSPALIAGLLGNLALAVIKVGVGLIGYSKLVLMDGLFSFCNAITLFLAWHGDKLQRKELDKDYPYGYGKFLFLALSVAGLIVLVVAIYMFFYGLTNMTWLEIHRSHTAAMMVSVISIAGNEVLYRYLREQSEIVSSNVLASNSVNNRIDLCVSLVCLLFITAASLGATYLERVGVVVVSITMFVMSMRMLFTAFSGIMDSVPSKELLSKIRSSASTVEGVSEVLNIKARYVGKLLYVDLRIAVDENINMGDADGIAREVEGMLAKRLPNTREVNVILS